MTDAQDITREMERTIEELTDSSSEVGAMRIERTLQAVWHARGYKIRTWTERMYHGLNGRVLFNVRSNIVNGWPDGRRA